MSEAAAATQASPTEAATPPPDAIDDAMADAVLSLLEPARAPKAKPEPAAADKGTEAKPELGADGKKTKEPEQLAAANGRKPPTSKDLDPLDPADFTAEKLSTPETLEAARERIQKAQRQALELTRASHRAHGAAEERERKLKNRETTIDERERRVSAVERYQSEQMAALEELEKGDADNFLQAVAKLRKTTDPVGFWKACTIAIASGKPVPKQQAQQAASDPELQARLDRLEQQLNGRAEADHQTQVEQLKARNLEAAKQNAATPRVVAYASDPRAEGAIRERLSAIMMSAYQQHGRPIDISQACEILESELSVHFELSQRADGKTNGEKGTTGPEPDAGRETSKDPPKPETTQQTIPAALSSQPASANRPRTEDELKQQQIRQLDAVGFFD